MKTHWPPTASEPTRVVSPWEEEEEGPDDDLPGEADEGPPSNRPAVELS